MSAPQTEVLVFVDGQEVARHILGPGAHVFGSGEACGIRIQAERVAAQHARLTVGEDGALLLEDLGGGNGTFLDGQTIHEPTPVKRNQTIQIGAAQILVLQHTLGAFGETTVTADGQGNGDATPELSPSPRYQLGPEIAKGGMGAVLAARQPAIRREVAMKVMLRNPSPHERLRFIEEAQITGQLEHPNIVPVHELAINEHGQPYYTMKLVKGSTLKEILTLLAQGDAAAIAKYPLAALLTIFQKVCDAVAFAHAKGVIHRDLKPANIMVGDYGEVLVMDWGLAKIIGGTRSRASPTSNADDGRAGARPSEPIIVTARDDQSEVFATLDGAVMGTPQYMSPEQARGEVATLDQRSDLFSLGAILYELVTLLPPFPGKTTREILSNIKSGHFILPNARLRASDAPHPRHLPGGVIPDSLEAVISKALAPDRSQRYQHVGEFQADLTAYQGGFATTAENAGAWKQLTLLVKRHKALSAAIAGSFLIIIGITAIFTTRVVAERNQTAAQRNQAVTEKQRAQKAEIDAEEANNRFREQLRQASRSHEATAEELSTKGDWGVSIAYFARALQYDPDNTSAALRLYQSVVFNEPGNAAIPHAFPGLNITKFSPDGKWMVTTSDDKTARVWDVVAGQPFGKPMRHEHWPPSILSPDGARMAGIGNDHTVAIWDTATDQLIGQPMRHEHPIMGAVFSPDGTRIVTTASDHVVQIWDVATSQPIGQPISQPMRHENWFGSVTFSPDGTRIATTCYDKTARVWDASTGLPIGEPMRHNNWLWNAAFSPDGTRIVTACYDGTARVWDATTGRPVGAPMRHDDLVRSATFSPDGTRIVTTKHSVINKCRY